jgi:hypothetical protein
MKTHDALRDAAKYALSVSKGLAPGRLPATLSVRAVNQYAFRVSSSSRVAIFQEKDTKAHVIGPITPKNARVLVFTPAGGGTVFARRTKAFLHPGTHGIHFMARGAEAGRLYLRRRMAEIFRG